VGKKASKVAKGGVVGGKDELVDVKFGEWTLWPDGNLGVVLVSKQSKHAVYVHWVSNGYIYYREPAGKSYELILSLAPRLENFPVKALDDFARYRSAPNKEVASGTYRVNLWTITVDATQIEFVNSATPARLVVPRNSEQFTYMNKPFGGAKPPGAVDAGGGNDVANFAGILRTTDAKDTVVQHPCHIHAVFLSAGRSYFVEMQSSAFDSFLRLENSSKTQVAWDDNGGGGKHARMTFTPGAAGTYRIIATSALPGVSGSYTVKVRYADGGTGGGFGAGPGPGLKQPGGNFLDDKGPAPEAGGAEKVTGDLLKLQGSWIDSKNTLKVTFTGGNFAYEPVGNTKLAAGTFSIKGKVRLSTELSPTGLSSQKGIDLEITDGGIANVPIKGVTMRGIYRFTGERLNLVFAPQPDSPRPKDFNSTNVQDLSRESSSR
jgi:hypothetical protein